MILCLMYAYVFVFSQTQEKYTSVLSKEYLDILKVILILLFATKSKKIVHCRYIMILTIPERR